MSTNRSEKITVDFFDEQIALEIKKMILDKVEKFNNFVALRQVNRGLNKLITDPTIGYDKYAFFTYYKPHSTSEQYIIALEKVTASDVRAGNQMVQQAIKKFCLGNIFQGETLLRKSMYRHGCYMAMQCLKEFASLPGRCSFQFNINELISLYHEQAKVALTNEYKSHFSEEEHPKCKYDLDFAISEFKGIVNDFIASFKEVYLRDNGVSESNSKDISNKMKFKSDERFDNTLDYGFSKALPPRLRFDKFDAQGFIGSASPNEKNDWYLSSSKYHSHFLKREAEINQLIYNNQQKRPYFA